MTSVQPSGRKIGKLFMGPFSRGNSEVAVRAKADGTVVRLIDSPRRVLATPMEQRLISTLKGTGSVSFASFVHAVSEDLFAEELRMGAGLLDIGLFGGRCSTMTLFKSFGPGDGILWQIESKGQVAR